MKSIRFLMLAAVSTALQADTREVVITSRLSVDANAHEEVVRELKEDSKALTRKYAAARGVETVETTVDADEDAANKCGCGKPRPKGEAVSEEDAANKCGCGKPRPKGEAVQEEAEQCTECKGHLQVADKIAVNDNGEEVCSDCSDVLRSCKSCCKKKCCKKCKKCCSSCTSTTTTSCCCH